MHTWQIKADSPFLWLYLYFWGASREKINVCRLWWSIFFGLPFFVIAIAIYYPFVWLPKKIWNVVPWKFQEAIRNVLVIVILLAFISTILGGVWVTVMWIISQITNFLDFLYQMTLLFASAVLAVCVIALLEEVALRPLGNVALRHLIRLIRPLRKVSRPMVLDQLTGYSERALFGALSRLGTGTGIVVEASHITETPRMIGNAWDLLAGFYHAVKYRTCPEIEVI